MDNLLGRRDLLSRVIKQREQSLEKLKTEFNNLQRESNRLQFTVEKLAIQNMEDKEKLNILEKEISEIPTLSRNKSNPVWKDYAKAITVILLFLLPVLSNAQDEPQSFGIFGAHVEYSAIYNQPGVGFFGGKRFGRNYLGLNSHCYLKSTVSIPIAVNAEYGFSFHAFQPYVLVGYHTTGGQAVKTNEGKQGVLYGGGISYYPVQTRLKIQVGITSINKFISVGYYRNL